MARINSLLRSTVLRSACDMSCLRFAKAQHQLRWARHQTRQNLQSFQQRCKSDKAGLPIEPPSAVQGVSPEGLFKVQCEGLSIAIATENQKCDAIQLRGECQADCALRVVGPNTVELVVPQMPPKSERQVAVLIPEKFSVNIDTTVSKTKNPTCIEEVGAGNVQLARLEGAAKICTSGANILLDKVTSADIALRSGGGSICARVLQGNTEINASPGGSIEITRLVAPTASIATTSSGKDCLHDAKINCAAAYADKLVVQSGGAPVRLGSSHSSVSATIESGGGSVALEGHEGEGPLTVSSSGGTIMLNISKALGNINLRSEGGSIMIKTHISQPLQLDLTAGRVDIDSQLNTGELTTDITVSSFV
eukprot:SAG31_NODE_205_length_20397_cov_19.191152_15_plen_365_part_00